MTSTSPPAIQHLECDPGADFVFEFSIPGNYATASGEMHVRSVRTNGIIVSGTVVFGAYDAGTATTPVTITITDTLTSALDPQQASYDLLITKSGLKEFWLAGDFYINNRITQTGVP